MTVHHWRLAWRAAVPAAAAIAIALAVNNAAIAASVPQVSDEPTSTGPAPTVPDEPTDEVRQRVTAFFATSRRYEQVCGNLTQVPAPAAGVALPERHRQLLNQKRLDQDLKAKAAADKRKILEKAARRRMVYALAYLRAKEAQSGWDTANAQTRFLTSEMEWYREAYDLIGLEKAARDAAQAAYKLYAAAYQQLPRREQWAFLKQFNKRVNCLRKQRRKVFEELHAVRNGLLDQAVARMGQNPLDRDPIAEGDYAMNMVALERAYGWLTPEIATHAAVHQTLLAAYERSLENGVLHPLVERAHLQNPGLRLNDPLAETETDRKVRLAIARTRAVSAVLHLYLEEVKTEAAYLKQLSLTNGVVAAYGRLKEEGTALAKDVVATGKLLQQNPSVSRGASALFVAPAAAYKVFGTSFSTLIATPVQDFMTDQVINPLISVAGFEKYKTTIEQAYDRYLKQRQGVDLSIKVLLAIIRGSDPRADYDQGRAFIRWLVDPAAAMPQLVSQARSGVGRLLENGEFVAASGGGLAHIFEAFALTPRESGAVALRGGRHALTGNARSGFHRIAVARGRVVQNPDLPLTAAVLTGYRADATADPVKQWWTGGDDYGHYQAVAPSTPWSYYVLPIVGQVQAVKDAVGAMKRGIRGHYGEISDQDGYLDLLVRCQDTYDGVLATVAAYDFDYDRLARPP